MKLNFVGLVLLMLAIGFTGSVEADVPAQESKTDIGFFLSDIENANIGVFDNLFGPVAPAKERFIFANGPTAVPMDPGKKGLAGPAGAAPMEPLQNYKSSKRPRDGL